MSATNAGSSLAAMRRKVRKTCPVCGKTFRGLKTAVYDRNACRQKAKRARAKEAAT